VLEYDFDKSVGYWICLTSQSIRRVLNNKLTQEGITLRQWEVLAELAYRPDLSQCQLAEVMGIEPPTLAGVINRMERDGWLERHAHADDRRKRRLCPTPKAEGIWQVTSQWCHEIREQAVKGISEHELNELKRICEKIRDNLGGEKEPSDCEDETPCDQLEAALAVGSRCEPTA
jgi:DNA-binding MarR family transcriptional regulator